MATIYDKMTSIANAIREKTGKTDKLTLDDMVVEIASISAGGGLNFEVVGSTTQPTNPSENTIWVNTDTEITGWYFSATQPENIVEGELWFKTNNFSEVSFNALKENTIQVYPSSVMQWVSGELKEVVAKTYKNGAWVDLWNGDVVRDGIAIKDLAVLNATWSSSTSGDKGNNATVTQKDGYVSVKGQRAGYCAAYAQVNITSATRLVVEGSLYTDCSEFVLAVWSKIGSYVSDNMIASALLTSTGASLDVSGLTGKVYVGITSVYTHEQKIVNLYLK